MEQGAKSKKQGAWSKELKAKSKGRKQGGSTGDRPVARKGDGMKQCDEGLVRVRRLKQTNLAGLNRRLNLANE